MRTGNFNSSTIVALLSNGTRDMTPEELAAWKKENPKSTKKTIESPDVLGESAITYIHECNYERRTGESLDRDTFAKPTMWGKLCEEYFQSKEEYGGIEYTQRPDEPIVNPEHPYHTGTPDRTKFETVGEIKCPYTLKSFCDLVAPLYEGLEGMDAMDAIRFGYTDKKGLPHKKHPDGEKYYKQIVSNAVILDAKYKEMGIDERAKYGELEIFMPYETELAEIQELAHNQKGGVESGYYFIAMGDTKDLPHLKDGGFYKNRNTIHFEIPQADKDALTERVLMAGKLLEEIKVAA